MCEQKRRISLNHPKNFKCQAFDKAVYREPADDWSIEPETKWALEYKGPDLYSESYRSTIANLPLHLISGRNTVRDPTSYAAKPPSTTKCL